MPNIIISPQTLLNALHWRYATKKFDPAKKIPAPTWSALEQALVLAPSSLGLQPWKFLIVQDAAIRRKLSAASHGQTQPVDCSHLVVFTLRKNLDAAYVDRYIERILEVRGGTKEALQGYRNLMVTSADQARTTGRLDVWMSRQVYIALGQFMAAAALLGVDTCPMEGIEPAKYDEILGLDQQGFTTLCVAAAGYRAADDKYATAPKVRFKLADVVSHI
jgi:nitroreductase